MNKEIPGGINYIITEDDILYNYTKIAIENNKTILIKGPKGSGKTSAVSFIAQELQLPLSYMQFTGTTSVDEFVGKYLIKDGSTYWIDGILARAMKLGHILVLDELNMALGEITSILHSVMDDRAVLIQGEKGEDNIIKAHKNFRIVATINPSDEGNYVGTKDMNEALLDRFKIVLVSKYPTIKKETDILRSKDSISLSEKTYNKNTGKEIKTKFDLLERISKVGAEIRRLDIEYQLSTRNLIDWAEICKFMTIKEAYKITFRNKLEKEEVELVDVLVDKEFSDLEIIK